MKKLRFAGLLVLALVLIFTGCAKKEEPKAAAKEAPKQAEKVLAIAMVTDVGGVNDQSFNQSAWEGLQRAEKELGIKASYKESKQDADYAPNMEALHDAKNDLVWGIGFLMGDAIAKAAKTYPDQKYAIIDFSYGDKTPPNVVGVMFQAEQPSFLVGYIAGKVSKTGTVGFVGGIKFPLIEEFEYGYKSGVMLANKNAKILDQYAESFTDAAKGKAMALQMYQKGADIVYHAAGAVGDGVIEAAKETRKWAIGVDKDQNYLAPDNVLTSAMKRVDNAIFDIAKKLKAGAWEGGKTVQYNLGNGGVGIAPTSNKHVPEVILKETEELTKKIIAGEIVVPKTKAEFEKFLMTLK